MSNVQELFANNKAWSEKMTAEQIVGGETGEDVSPYSSRVA